MSLVEHAERELSLAGWNEEDSKGVMQLIKVFAEQGHGGGSAMPTLAVFYKLARFKTLTPLMGTSEEWMEVNGGLQQNIRCGSVVKEIVDGVEKCHDIDAWVYEYADGCQVVSGSRGFAPVKFPYHPPTSPRVIKLQKMRRAFNWVRKIARCLCL